jgi:uncharacterized protein
VSGVTGSAEFSAVDFVAAGALKLEHEVVPDDQVVSGSPTTGSTELGTFDGHEYGVWEHSVGASSDVEADELYVVLSGAGTVQFDGGDLVVLGPGSVGRLREGQRTIWTVTETLRKVYLA